MSNELKEKRDYINSLSNEIKGREQSLAYIKMDFKKAKNEYNNIFIEENINTFPFKSGDFLTFGFNDVLLLKVIDIKFNIGQDEKSKSHPIVFSCLEIALFNTGAKIRQLYKNFSSFFYIFDSWQEMMNLNSLSVFDKKNNLTEILDLCYKNLNNELILNEDSILEFNSKARISSIYKNLFPFAEELELLYRTHLGVEGKW